MIEGWGTLRPRRRLGHGEILLFAALALGTLTLAALVAWFLLSIFAVALDLPFNQVEVTVETEATVVDHRVTVTGSTDLPDGAVLDWWIEPIMFADPLASGSVTVHDGAFSFTADASDWEPARIFADVELSVDTETQPADVTDRLGESGERMTGPDVYDDSGDKHLSIRVPIDLRQP